MVNKIKNDVKTIKKDFVTFFNDIVKNKKYYIPVILFCVIAYAFEIFNRTVSIDDLSYANFGYEDHLGLSGFRWGLYLLDLFIGVKEYTPFIGRFLALIFLLVDVVLLSFIFYILNNKNTNVWRYTALSSMFCTYPLINELWYCNGLSVAIAFNGASYYFIFVLLAAIYLLYEDKINVISVFFCGVVIAPAMAGYESIVFAYVSLVFIIIYYKNINSRNNGTKYNWFMDGVRYALPLVVALIIRYAIGYLLIWALELKGRGGGNNTIKWFSGDIGECIKGILYNGWYYIIRGLSYYPIGEFVVALIVFIIITIKQEINKQKYCFGFGLLLIISLFFLSLLQGEKLNYRTAQTVQLFMAFVSYLVIACSENTLLFKKYNLGKIVTVLLVLVLLRQSIYTHELLALNNQRSDNEAFVARQIGYKLYSEFDVNKTVVFCGEYQLGDFIESQITVKEDSIADRVETWVRDIVGHDEGRLYQEFVCTNINSFFNTQMDAFGGQGIIQKYLSYFGYDIKVLDDLSREEESKLKGYYEEIAKKENMMPLTIKDMGDYILVYLGPTIDRYDKLEDYNY